MRATPSNFPDDFDYSFLSSRRRSRGDDTPIHRGGSTGEARGRSPPPPRRLLAKKSRRQADQKWVLSVPECAKTRPLMLKNRKIFWAGGTAAFPDPNPGGEGSTPSPLLPPRRLDPRAYGARLDSRLRRSTTAPTVPPFASL